MNTIICIEGPDNIGKTKFAKILWRRFDAPIDHLGAPKNEDKELIQIEQKELAVRIIESIKIWGSKQDNAIRVWDRSILGEMVYGPLYRDYDAKEYGKYVREKLHAIPNVQIFLIIFCADSLTYQKFGIPPKSEEKIQYQKQEEAKRISERFMDVAEELFLLNTLIVDCNRYKSLEDRNRATISWIESRLKGEL